MKRIVDFFTKDPILKIGSLLVSILIWFICMNITDPIEKKEFSVNLSLYNTDMLIPNNRVLMNQGDLEARSIKIMLEGPRSALENLDRAKLSAYIDFKLAEILNSNQIGVPIITSVLCDLPPDLENRKIQIVNVSPKTVDISLDKIVTITRAITKNIIGEVAEGYISQPPEIFPDTVRITGPQLDLAQIGSVRAEYDLNNASQSIHETAILKIYTNDNEEFKFTEEQNITQNVTSVTIDIEVKKLAKIPIVVPEPVGSPADNYAVTKVYADSDYLQVAGDEDEIAKVKSFILDAIDINGISETMEYEIDIRNKVISTNLSIPLGTPHTVIVTVEVDEIIEREIVKNSDDIEIIGLSGDLEIITESVSVQIRGLKSVLDTLLDEDITVQADVSDLEAGQHEIAVSFTVPSDVTVLSEQAILEIVITDPEDVSDLPDSTELPAETEPSGTP